jgi:NADPH-dependent 2,4-dienoyl-CoA reductase/sulfur reductase-like enzyme
VHPEVAEAVVRRGQADLVGLARAIIADPELVAKDRAGRAADIRPCIAVNDACIGRSYKRMAVRCAVNPVAGHGALDRPAAAEERQRVVVVGGGPGGLEAAWVAAARGHDVTLLERGDALGGKIRLAQLLPGRAELADFADWRAGECERRGVDIRLEVEAGVDEVLALEPDAVVVATGGRATVTGSSKWHPMPVPGSDRDFVVDHERALVDADRLGSRVVILDAVGHIEGVGLGELLAAAGKEVTVALPLPTPMLLDGETMAQAIPRAARAGARWRPNTVMVSIGDHEAILVDVYSGRLETLPADTVVIRTHGLPNAQLYLDLVDRVPEVVRVGDAVAVRPVDRAIFDGHIAGRHI